MADLLGMEFAMIHKERRHPVRCNGSPVVADVRDDCHVLVGDVRGKVVVLIDDLIDTASTLVQAAQVLADNGAVEILALISHGIMSGTAIEMINASPLDRLVVTNSVPQREHLRECKKLVVLDAAPLIAEAIRRIHNGESVSYLFENAPLVLVESRSADT